MKKAVISLLIVVLLLLTSCSSKEIIITDSIYAFGTTIEIMLGHQMEKQMKRVK